MIIETKDSIFRRLLCRPPSKQSSPSDCCCVALNNPLNKPDPAIYSQDEEIELGRAPTWDNPDIETNQLSPFKLLSEVRVKIRNLSTTASMINGYVHLYTSSFGLGIQRELLSSQILSLPPNTQTALSFPLKKAILDGDQSIGVYVFIDHPHDKIRINSRGYQMIKGGIQLAPGPEWSYISKFPVLNQSNTTQQITLSVLPNELNATVSPSSQNFSPWEQIEATLEINAPQSLSPTKDFNNWKKVTVVARNQDGSLIDGLTYILQIKT